MLFYTIQIMYLKYYVLAQTILFLLSPHLFALEPTQRIQQQYLKSIDRLALNLLPNGGVIASPSTNSPNYYFDWVRDTALTMKTVVDLAYAPTESAITTSTRQRLLSQINLWISYELKRQQIATITGLGEPRYNTDLTANNDSWGRPQNDGPALRALTAIKIAHHWIKKGRVDEVRKNLYDSKHPNETKALIKNDLEYVAHHWAEPSFDLWEEEKAFHFYTLVVQRSALLKGADLADLLQDPGAAHFYRIQAQKIFDFLTYFKDHSKNTYIYSFLPLNLNSRHHDSNLDSSIVLATIHTYDAENPSNNLEMDWIHQTANELILAFKNLYKINQLEIDSDQHPLGIALGRYVHDVYDGIGTSQANPWYLTTLAVAELACKSTNAVPININPEHQFNRVLYHQSLAKPLGRSDQSSGSLSEQFHRTTGIPTGARDLTWSHTAYITAYQACYGQ